MPVWKPVHLSSSLQIAVLLLLVAVVSPAVLAQDGGPITPSGQNDQLMLDESSGANPGAATQMNQGYSQNQFTGGAPAQVPSYVQRPTNGWVSLQQQPQLPPGLLLPIMLDTSLDMNGLKNGDYVQAHLAQNISAGGSSYLPGGTRFYGTIGEDDSRHFEKKAAKMGILFMQLKMPNGTMIPLRAHLVGQLGNYLNNDGRSHGEGLGQRLMSDGWRGGLGSGLASGFGSVFGAIADGGRGPGSGAFVGAAMGGGSGLMESLMYRRGHDTIMHAGTQLQIQLDTSVNLPWSNSGSNRYLPGTGRNTGIF